MTDLVYARGTRSVDELREDVDKFWRDFDTDGPARSEVTGAGVDVEALDGVDRKTAIEIRARGAGIDPSTVAIVIAFAPTANAVLTSLWHAVLLPRIRARYGRDAIREERPPES
jgi:hypothetical protein